MPFAKACRLRPGEGREGGARGEWIARPSSVSLRPTLGRVPETPPCPLLADQSGRLTWASERAAWSRHFAGRQVRCWLNRRAAVATSLRTLALRRGPGMVSTTRSVVQLVIRFPAYRTAGQSKRRGREFTVLRVGVRVTHGSITESLLAERSKIRVFSRLPWWRSSLACLS
jgi:hypothetical protein